MTTLTVLYSSHVATTRRFPALEAAYKSLPAARLAMETSPAAHRLIDAASTYQAQLLNTISHSQPGRTGEFAATATTRPHNSDSLMAQLALASINPMLNGKLNLLLAAHKEYEKSLRPLIGQPVRRFLNLIKN